MMIKSRIKKSKLLKVNLSELFKNRQIRNMEKQNNIINPIPNLSFANMGRDKEINNIPIEAFSRLNSALFCLSFGK